MAHVVTVVAVSLVVPVWPEVVVSGADYPLWRLWIVGTRELLGPPEGHEVGTSSVEGGQHRCQNRHPVNQGVDPSPARTVRRVRGRPKRQENLVLAKETS